MASLYQPVYKDRTGQRKASKRWYGRYVDEHGSRRRVPLSEDKKLAQLMLAKIVQRAELRRRGIIDQFEAHRTVPLLGGENPHIEDWAACLKAKGVTAGHADLVVKRARAVLEAAKAFFLADLVPSRILTALDGLAQRNGISLQTKNFYLQAIKQFGRWLAQDGRIPSSPLAHLQGWNAKTDRRHDRRALDPEEAHWLLETTRTAGERFRLSGLDRHWLYRLALSTGFRASELASLTPESFDLSEREVTIQAGYAKNRRKDTLPLPDFLFPELAEWLAGKKPGKPVWDGPWAKNKAAGVFLRGDLEAARAKWLEQWTGKERETRAGSDFLMREDSRGLFVDFHSLRHSFVTWAVSSGVNPKTVQTMARHSTITLTMDRYTSLGAFNLSGAVNSIPDPLQRPEGQAAQATGTDGRTEKILEKTGVAVLLTACPKKDPERVFKIFEDKDAAEEQDAAKPEKQRVLGEKSGEEGIRTLGEDFSPRRFSKPVLSATQPPLRQ